ncbi:MAG: type II secretion system GspH family protein [Actinomycetota bacterium]|nr:type II secretion system GspH family protein [Actinomycetota bacterium]
MLLKLFRRLRRDERGITLSELLVAMSILSIVMVIFGSVLASVQGAVVRQDSLSRTLDSARLGLQQLDHEMRSGNVLYDPALENGSGAGAVTSCTGCLPGYTLRVYTQTNSLFKCVLWKIDANQNLLTREWPPLDTDSARPWRVVATGIINRTLGEAAWTLDSDSLKGGRTLNVVYAVNNDLIHLPAQTVRVQSSLTGRNTSYGYPANVCQTTPSG